MRTALAVSGVAFAVVLIFMQLGFLGSAQRSATLVFDALDFDVLIRSRHYLHLVASRTFPRGRLEQAASLSGVEGLARLSRVRFLAESVGRQQAGDARDRRRSQRSRVPNRRNPEQAALLERAGVRGVTPGRGGSSDLGTAAASAMPTLATKPSFRSSG